MRPAPVALTGPPPRIQPEQRLAVAVLTLAVRDAESRSRAHHGRAELARGWLQNGSDGLRLWTHLAGFDDPQALVRRVRAALRLYPPHV